MPAPSFIQEAETVWNTSTSPKTTASFNVLAGDVLVAYLMSEQNVTTPGTISGGSLTWTQRVSLDLTNDCGLTMWTATVDTDKSMTVTFTATASGGFFGANVLTFRGSDGVGATANANAETGGPTVNITTTQANSAIVVANGDWAAADGASRTWRTNAGSFTEQTYFRDSARYTVYGGYHADAGSIGTYAVGLSAPSQDYSLGAVEVKGTAAAAAASLPPFRRAHRGLYIPMR